MTRILAIETSCDETAAAVVENGRRVLSSVVASQIEIHARYGGVFPEVASRQHILAIAPVAQQALRDAHLSLQDVDAVAVTRGPGLPGSLAVGVNYAKGLALAAQKPLLGINHLEGHIYGAWLYREHPTPEPQFPLLALLVSGGHTELILMKDHMQYQRLGGTRDDAAGEAFDKVARLLKLGYPGGPAIQKAAQRGDPESVPFPRPWLKGTWDFSFSGLKTAVLRLVRRLEEMNKPIPQAHLAAAFQAAVVDVLVGKTLEAAKTFGVKSIVVAGGVSANKLLRERITAESPVPVHIPPLEFCTDNAAMIAAAAFRRFQAGQIDDWGFDLMPNWRLG